MSAFPTSAVALRAGSRRFRASIALAALGLMAWCGIASGQSTFGTVLGTVRDPTRSVVPNARVQLVNTGTNALREVQSTPSGTYQFVNIDTGTYTLTIEAAGFQKTSVEAFDLGARETKHIDMDLQVASGSTTVTVAAVSVVQADVSNVAVTKGSLELNDLPVAIYTRSQGSTSAFSTLTSQPGVQTDGGNIMVAGATTSQLSVTVDGISSMGPSTWGPLTELFPSFNAIEEIKISETLNPAEYGGVADITTISKSGTNTFHGGAFENLQNTAFNASDTFSHEVNPVHMNNFGAYLGGPVIVPGLYNGRNKTFFFASGELLRLPKSVTSVISVPTAAMRNGDLSAYLDPANGGSANQLVGYPGNIIPTNQLSAYSQKLLNLYYPLPNYGPPNAVSNNYLASYFIPINSAQWDLRMDENINPKNLVYARYTYKNRRVIQVPDSGGSPLVGNTSIPEVYNSFTLAYNWIISPTLVNELRGGFTAVHRNVTFGVTAQSAATDLGLTTPPLPGPIPTGFGIPTINLAGFIGLHNPSAYLHPAENTYQIIDSLTWTKSQHTMKFGFDWRYMNALYTQVFADYQLGNYSFNGSSPANQALLGTGGAVPVAALLLGYPDNTGIATVTAPNTDSWAQHYAVFAQDDWKISPSFTLNYGLRWEYHPPFADRLKNLANWVPNYTSTVNGQTVNGAVVIPNGATSIVDPAFAQAIYPTPILTAGQLGIPNTLKFTTKKDFAPRLGFAWRLGSNNKTVLRGGYGRYIQSLLSGAAGDGWAVAGSDVGFFTNTALGSNGRPALQLPYSFPANISQPGTAFFDLGVAIHNKDPIVEEWNLTLERDLGKGVGLRVSYEGNHSYNMPIRQNVDQLHPNTSGYSLAATPYPLMSNVWLTVPEGYGNHHSGTIAVRKRTSTLQFEGSYVYTRDLTNVNGVYAGAAGFVNENGAFMTNPYDPNLDYGNTPFARRHRVLFTFLYELPIGRGKAFMNSTNGVVDRIVGGWVLSGIALFQSGAFMSVATLSDPSGTGFNIFNGIGGRADTVSGVNPYQGQSLNQWINPAAFADPGNNIGRFGDSTAGSIVGPGTKAVSLALLKRIRFTEGTRAEIGAQVANVFNHPNYNPPGNLLVGVPGFGQITSMQTAEGAGPRAMQLVARITF